MCLEQGRSIVHGTLILAFAAIAFWVNNPLGLALVAFMGVVRLQEYITGWCPADLVLRPMGLKKMSETIS